MTEIENVLNRIKTCRKNKGFSHEYMAYKLNISQATYTNIETQTSKLSVQRLIEISDILEQPASYFLGEQIKEVKVSEMNEELKSLLNELIKSKDSQINIFRKLLEK